MSLLPGLRCLVSGKRSLLSFAFTIAFIALAPPTPVSAQTAGTLRGKVADPTGALIPGAAVTLTEDQTVLHVQSGNDGAYIFKAVPPGSCTVEVDAPGFAHFSKGDIAIELIACWTWGKLHAENC